MPMAFFTSINAAWKALQDRNVMLEDTEEGYAAQLGDSVSSLSLFRYRVFCSGTDTAVRACVDPVATIVVFRAVEFL